MNRLKTKFRFLFGTLDYSTEEWDMFPTLLFPTKIGQMKRDKFKGHLQCYKDLDLINKASHEHCRDQEEWIHFWLHQISAKIVKVKEFVNENNFYLVMNQLKIKE